MPKKHADQKPKYCAVYTRTSTDEGLNQAFNSLQAQREACEAYIASQLHEEWRCCPERYDDGGFSGGTLERPSLRRLLADVAAGTVDVIVIYKIDRLTRALSDFARIVEALDRAKASFVSVTQSFNTTTSMGRLTLNVLLSFAQFEREVGAERVRDKIAASKKKGMWMGGVCPLGYDVRDRALVVNESEAQKVKLIFELYLRFGSVLLLDTELHRREIRSKLRLDTHGKKSGGKRFSRGALYVLLRNVLYIGRVPHRGESYPGLHAGIINPDVFVRAQQTLDANQVGVRGDRPPGRQPRLLTGLLWDCDGRLMGASHTVKDSRRYGYYVSRPAGQFGDGARLRRVPTGEIETLVVDQLQAFLQNAGAIYDAAVPAELEIAETKRLIAAGMKYAALLRGPDQAKLQIAIAGLVNRVVLGKTTVRICVALDHLLAGNSHPGKEVSLRHWLSVPARLIRRTREIRLVIPGSPGAGPEGLDPGLIKLLVRAREARLNFEAAEGRSVRDVAKAAGMNFDYFSVLLKLSFLAPDIVQEILEGRQRAPLTRQFLARMRRMPVSWDEQRTAIALLTSASGKSW